MKKIASKYYDAETGKMYDKPGQILDILLVGKYGTRRVNSLMKEFTNNQGVIERDADLELLADTVAAMFKDQWDKRYEALTIEYDMLKPYNIELTKEDTEVTAGSKISNTSTSGGSTSETSNNEVENKSDVVSKSGSETSKLESDKTNVGNESKSTNTSTSDTANVSDNDVNIKSHDGDKVTKETAYDHAVEGSDERIKYTETVTKSGVETTQKTGKETTTDKAVSKDGKIPGTTTEVINNGHELLQGAFDDKDIVGTSHKITGDITAINEGDKEISSTTPYAPVGMRDVNQTRSHGDITDPQYGQLSSKQTRNLDEEVTVDHTVQSTKVKDEHNTEITKDYSKDGTPLSEKKTYGDPDIPSEAGRENSRPKETTEKSGSITETTETDGSVIETDNNTVSKNESSDTNEVGNKSYNENKTENATNQTDTSEDSTRNGTTTKAGDTSTTVSNDSDSTNNESSNETHTADSKTIEQGNKWNATNQQMLMQELELRMNNFYEQMLKEVAKLLTLSIYNQEEIK